MERRKERTKKNTRKPILSYIKVRDYLSSSFVGHDDRCDFGTLVRAIEIDRSSVCLFFLLKSAKLRAWARLAHGSRRWVKWGVGVRGWKGKRSRCNGDGGARPEVITRMRWRWAVNQLSLHLFQPLCDPAYRFALISSLRPSRTFATSRPRALETLLAVSQRVSFRDIRFRPRVDVAFSSWRRAQMSCAYMSLID